MTHEPNQTRTQDEGPTLSQKIRDKVDELLARRARLGAIIYTVLFAAIGLVTGIFEDHPARSLALGALILASGAFRFHTALSLGRARSRAGWRARLYAGVGVTSLAWGAFCFLSIRSYGVSDTAWVVLFPTAGIAAGSILSFAPLVPLVCAHLLLMLGPVIAGLLTVPESGLKFAVLTGVYLGYLILQGRQICRTVLDDISKGEIILGQKAALLAQKEKALAASRTKERFLAMMSHEVRTPLNGILGASELILAERQDPALLEQAAIIRGAGENLLLIFNDMLTFSELERGRVEFAETPFDIVGCARDSVALFEAVAARKGVRLNHFVDPRMPRLLLGDPVRLKQVLVNLLGNAIKFTERGEVVLTVGSSPGKAGVAGAHDVEFSVTDTGVGIEPSDLSRIFELFAQGDDSSKRRFGGAGLGLAVCKKICDAMGGRIEVRSEPGKGSTFVFSVSLKVAESGALAALVTPRGAELLGPALVPFRASVRGEGGGRRYRVLLVDDQEANQKLAGAYLAKCGYVVDYAANGFAAVEAARRTVYDAILMDCQMPEMDGFEATRRIRAIEGLADVPIIAVTASALEGDRERCLSAGMSDYLTKPLRFPVLSQVLERWVRKEGGKCA